MKFGIVVLAVLGLMGCEQLGLCVEQETLPTDFGGSCVDDDDCDVVRGYATCGIDCDCGIVVAADARKRFDETRVDVSLCCDGGESICDCAAPIAGCVEGRCVDMSPR